MSTQPNTQTRTDSRTDVAVESNSGTSLKAMTGNQRIMLVDQSKHVNTIVICAVVSTVAALVAIAAYLKAYNAETEARIVQYYLMDPHSRTPEELAAWAKFNREHESRVKGVEAEGGK